MFNERERFYIQIGHALSSFQLIEELLKVYIEVVSRLIRAKVPAKVAFKFSSADYKDASLGTLLAIFNKMNANTKLQKNLRDLKRERNYVAHVAVLHFLKAQQMKMPKAGRSELLRRIQDLDSEAYTVFLALHDELTAIMDE